MGLRAVLALSLLAGIGLRLWDGYGSSLWLDELHSLAHASPATAAGVAEHVHWDFHVPLFFLGLHAIWSPGTRPEILRLVPILSSLLVLVPLIVFVRRSRLGAWAVPLAVLFFSFLPYQILYATELRPYAWIMLASSAACVAAFTDAGSTRFRFALFALAVAFGILTHLLMAGTVLLIGVARLLFALPPLRDARFASRGALLDLRWLILAGAIGACAFLPWLFQYMDWVIHKPGELVPPDAATRSVTEANRTDLLQAPLKTLVPQLQSLGQPWGWLATAGAALLVAGITIGGAAFFVRAFRRDRPPIDRSIALALTFALLALVVVLAGSIWSWARVSIRYLVIAAWLWPLVMCELLAAVRSARLRTAVGALLIAGVVLAGIGHAGGKTREDVRGAVREARLAGAGLLAADTAHPPLYTALLSQPPRFEHDTPYLAYANHLEQVELKLPAHAGPKPVLLPKPGEPGFDRPVVVITRRYLDLDTAPALDKATREGMPEIPRLRNGRRMVRKIPIDETMTVWIFAPEAR